MFTKSKLSVHSIEQRTAKSQNMFQQAKATAEAIIEDVKTLRLEKQEELAKINDELAILDTQEKTNLKISKKMGEFLD